MGDLSDPETSSSGSDGGSDSEAPEKQVEWLATGRSKRSTAGNRMKSMLANEEPDDDLELLFAEDGDDAGFTDLERDDASDVQMDSSEDEEDATAAAAGDDLEGEEALQKEAKAKRMAQRKRKAQEAIPAKFRKKVRIEQPATGSQSPASSTPAAAPSPSRPRPKKKSERASWLPSPADMPTRASERSTTRLSKEQLHQQMVERELKRKKQMEILEKKAKRLEAMKKPPMTQAQRLAEAAVVEKRNSKSLNRWEEAEKQREEERLKKIAALHSRKLDGPVVTLWSGIQQLEGEQMKHAGKMVSVEEKAPRKKRQSTVAAAPATPATPATTTVTAPATQPEEKPKPDEKPRDAEPRLNVNGPAEDGPTEKPAGVEAPAPAPALPAQPPPTDKSGPAESTPSAPPAPPLPPTQHDTPATPTRPLSTTTIPDSSPPRPPSSGQPAGGLAPPSQQQNFPPSSMSPMAPPPIPPPPDTKLSTSSVLAAPVLAPPLGATPPILGFPSPGTKSTVLAAPSAAPAPSSPPPPPPIPRQLPPATTTPSAPDTSSTHPEPPAPATSFAQPDRPGPNSTEKAETATEPRPEADAEPPLEGKVTKSCIILQNFDDTAIRDKQVQTQILFGRKMNKLGKPGHPPLCAITNHAARYRDPKTGLPYYNSYAFREIQRLRRGDYRWSRLVGAWMGSGTLAARGVPERFLDPSKESPNARKKREAAKEEEARKNREREEKEKEKEKEKENENSVAGDNDLKQQPPPPQQPQQVCGQETGGQPPQGQQLEDKSGGPPAALAPPPSAGPPLATTATSTTTPTA